MISRPKKDPYAKYALDPSNRIPLSILKNQTVQEAVERAKTAFDDSIQQLLASDSVVGSENIVMALLVNKMALKIYGNNAATI